ncbi:hypothetical protein LPB72_13135 [Hydrogenophaga crassostreae]|uniref:Uncharacterized protein n=1 Tax=Hydrogenophaga crassostreae TaxID=1763535 RepID=A0ABX2U5E3_9BURK|nr:hypothetical protein LPB72_13135 [Hydrogenophaga crassostreae]
MGVLALTGASLAWGGTAAVAQEKEQVTVLRCEPVYLPARETWAREVELVGREGRLSQVRIDGQAVYTFSVHDTTVLTSQDNERIQIDFAARTWRSDFRGLASGQGRCELAEP